MPISDESLPPGGQMLRQAFEALVVAFNERGVSYANIEREDDTEWMR